jgi:hypothetical protein
METETATPKKRAAVQTNGKDSDFEWIYELFVIVFSVVFTLIMYIL